MKAQVFLIGESRAIKHLNKQIQRLAGTTHNVLIEGERGVGRTTVAHHVHGASKDRAKPFLPLISCLSSDQEIKRILFPEEVKQEIQRKQIPEIVDGSTVFIKDVQDLSFSNQARLAKFLEEKKGRPRARIIATIKQPLESCYERGMLVEDLFTHLSQFEGIYIPPLRERPEDIPALANHFVTEACAELGVKVKTLDANTLDLLAKYDWKDNVHGLKAVIDKSVYYTAGEALSLPSEILDERSHLQGIISNIESKKRFSMDLSLENIEKLLLQRMLRVFGYNQTRVAETLGITEGNLRYRLKKYKIPSARER